jgi:hypothetical protein
MTLRIILIICTLLFSNGAQSIEQNDPVQQSYLNDTSQPALNALPDAVQNLLQFSLKQVGVSYHRGGTSPETGFDCSQGLKSEQILLESKIMAVADVVEAMSSHRPYRAGFGIEAALDEIILGRGARYDPQVVDACVALFQEKKYVIPD